jgi:hypothetical protein
MQQAGLLCCFQLNRRKLFQRIYIPPCITSIFTALLGWLFKVTARKKELLVKNVHPYFKIGNSYRSFAGYNSMVMLPSSVLIRQWMFCCVEVLLNTVASKTNSNKV